jgi:rhodanese-related sulfurtransferase
MKNSFIRSSSRHLCGFRNNNNNNNNNNKKQRVRLYSPLWTVAATTTLFAHSASAFVPNFLAKQQQQQQQQHQWFSTTSSDYATPDEIQTLLNNEKTVILDVRRADEIQSSGYFKTSKQQWVTIPCTPTDASLLQMTASNLLRDKSAPVLVHCAAGKRAAMAKQVLEEMGYETVVNAGGFAALEPFVEKN